MFESFLKERLPLQLYGKLPLAKDYLRVGASRGRARLLRDWLDAAFSTRVVSQSAPTIPWPIRFLLAAGSESPLVGNAWPSSDMGGERAFPFTMFVERRRKALLHELERGVDRLAPIWDQIESCRNEADGFHDGQSFLADMRTRELALPSESAGAASRIDWHRWVAALWPERGEDGLGAILASLAGAETVRGPIRLPLAFGAPLVPQVQGWWAALATLRVFDSGSLPTLVFPAQLEDGPEPGFAVFFLRELRIDEVEWVTGSRSRTCLGPNDYCGVEVCRMDAVDSEPEAGPSLADSLRGRALAARAKA